MKSRKIVKLQDTKTPRTSRPVGVLTSTTDGPRSHNATPAVVRVAGVVNVSKQIFMRVKLFCAFRSRHPHPWMHTPLPIDTHLYFYHHPTTPTVGIVYDTIRLIISCLYATIDRTANCTRHSDSKTVAPRALLQPFRSKFEFFFHVLFSRFTRSSKRVLALKPVKLVLLDSPPDLVTPFRDFSSTRTTRDKTSKCHPDTSILRTRLCGQLSSLLQAI